MFDSPIIDVAIALCFTYFILGLLVTTIHEFVFSVLMSKEPKRAKYLKESIQNLFFDTKWKPFVDDTLLNSIHFQVLQSDRANFPSYVPNSNFALAILDLFRDGNNTLDMGTIREKLTKPDTTTSQIPESLRKMLLSMLDRSGNELSNLQAEIEHYFNTAMDRLGGSYVRSTKRYILLIAAILAISLNVDTIHIVSTLWSNPDALRQTADNIQATVKQIDSTGTYNIQSPDGKTLIMYSKVRKDSVITDSTIKIDSVFNKETIKQTIVTLENAGIPIGWDKLNYPNKATIDKEGNAVNGTCGSLVCAWAVKLFGLLLTSFALLLGAPFWFDLLNKIVNIRAAGKKDAEVDKPDPKPVQPVSITLNSQAEGAVG